VPKFELTCLLRNKKSVQPTITQESLSRSSNSINISSKNNDIYQGCQTYGPWAKTGPRDNFVR